jgi:hypothetical protein
MVGIFDPACKLLPSWTKELYLCTSPLPKLNVLHSIYRQCVAVGVLICAVDHFLHEFYTLFLTRFRTYEIVSPPQTK